MAFGPENLALPHPEIASRVNWCLEVTGMAGMRKASTVTLSGGQKQRTAIAATLAMRPRILVLDEPLSDLDPVGAQEVLGTLQRLANDEGTGVVIIEHRVDEVAPWADRVVLMDAGRILLDQPPREAWANPALWPSASACPMWSGWRTPSRRVLGRDPALGGGGGRRPRTAGCAGLAPRRRHRPLARTAMRGNAAVLRRRGLAAAARGPRRRERSGRRCCPGMASASTSTTTAR